MQAKTKPQPSRRRGALRSDQRVNRAPITFEAFRRRTRGLPPSRQLEAFQSLPPAIQSQVWAALAADLEHASEPKGD